jgi:DNA helicase HerA-like ATPase
MNELTLQDKQELLQASLLEVDNIVFKGYLDNIKNFEIEPLDTLLPDAVQKIRLNKVTRIVYDKNEDNLDKFNNAYAALHSCDSALTIILKGSKKWTDIYIGTNKINADAAFSGYDAGETLTAALNGNFQGIEFGEKMFDDDIQDIALNIKSSENNYLTSVAGVPSFKSDDKKEFVQGLEKIIEGMKNRAYTAVIQATPVSRHELEVMEGAYQDIYSALALFEQKQITMSENESKALGTSLTEGITTTLSRSIGETQTSTTGSSSSTSDTNSKTRSDWDVKGAIAKAASGALTGALTGGLATGLASGGLATLPGAAIGAAGGIGMGLITGLRGGSKTNSHTTTSSYNSSESNAFTSNKTSSIANSLTTGSSETSTLGTSKSLQITEKNRRVQALLEVIDEQLKRIQECKNYGMWSWGAYFIGEEQLNVKLGADLYSGMLRGETTGLERNAITTWNRNEDENKFDEVINYVSQLKHPVFKTPEYFRTAHVTPTSLISTKEVSIAMSLPQKSLPGIPVFESVEFGRAVTTYRAEESKKQMRIGSIFNLGNIDKNLDVDLDIDSLTSHTFITGSTGSGKSNSIYLMLNYLWKKKGIPFLIVEPAKGEYKNIFGGNPSVSVFGTNPKLMPLLKINPFAFPNEIHVIEHIDRLIEILNAVWPMYAAMPAILKEAVELTYEKMGWDLLNSQSKYKTPAFPDFQDLLDVLPKVIEKSGYSDEIKSNYAGALLTRVRSLTNGYFKTIFQKEELQSEELFDKPCIVDLSRVGSSETKSLLMGMVFLKLQEYRMSKASARSANSELKHITVLEEAHNLLRRTSSEQSQEGANLQGKSVEMISNAIAEMRTYGEGFIIADQAPGLLDQSVIRNTNTKIILRLPDWDDRNLVGKASNLKEEQIEELARLRTGCAAVYQNDWQEAVLCQFDFFDKENHKPFEFNSKINNLTDSRKRYKTELIKILLNAKLANQEPAELVKEKDINLEKFSIYYPEIINNLKENLSSQLSKILEFPSFMNNIEKNIDIDIWSKSILAELANRINEKLLDETLQKELLKSVLDIIAIEHPINKEKIEEQKENIDNNWRLVK